MSSHSYCLPACQKVPAQHTRFGLGTSFIPHFSHVLQEAPASSSLERDLVFESLSGSEFKGLDTSRHFVWFDDQEELVVRGMDFAF